MSEFHFHQAIQTRWLAPTDTKPSRVKAFCPAGAIVVAWDYALGVEGNHAAAAMMLVRRLEWIPERGNYAATWRAGSTLDQRGYVFVAGGSEVPVTYQDKTP